MRYFACVLLLILLWLTHGIGMIFYPSSELDWAFKIVKYAALAWALVLIIEKVKKWFF